MGELIENPWSGVIPSPSVVVHNFKHEYLCNQWADNNEILSEASLGKGKGCIRSLATDSSHRVIMEKTVLPLFLSCFSSDPFLYLQVMITCMGARRSSKFSQIRPPTAELAALEHLKKYPLIMGKTVLPLFLGCS